MESYQSNITQTIIDTINTIFNKLFSSIDNSLYSLLDNLFFIDENILKENYLKILLGNSVSKSLLILANSLLVGFCVYYCFKLLFSHFSYIELEKPHEFIFKLLIYGICINYSYFICEKLLFSIDGLLKSFISIGLFNLIFSYSLRYILIKVFVLITPFSILTLINKSTSWFFKTWFRSLISLLLLQSFVSIILLIIFSINFNNKDIFSKFLYLGGIYTLSKSNNYIRELIGGISTNISSNINNFIKKY